MPNLDSFTPGLTGQGIKLFVILLQNLRPQGESLMPIVQQNLPLIVTELGDPDLNTKPANISQQDVSDLAILEIPTFVQNRHKCIDDINRP